MKRILTYVCCMFLMGVVLAGCGGSNGTTSVEPPAGTGYSLGLQASTQTVMPGTSVQLTAWAIGPDGQRVMSDDDGVQFSANLRGSFENQGKAKIANGVAVINFTFEDNSPADDPDPSRVLRITGSYRGAVTALELTAVARGF